jgi:hypothetical protein
MSKARLSCWLGWDLSEYKAFKNMITGVAAIDDMVKHAWVFDAQCNDVLLLPRAPVYLRYFRVKKSIMALFEPRYLAICQLLSVAYRGPIPRLSESEVKTLIFSVVYSRLTHENENFFHDLVKNPLCFIHASVLSD